MVHSLMEQHSSCICEPYAIYAYQLKRVHLMQLSGVAFQWPVTDSSCWQGVPTGGCTAVLGGVRMTSLIGCADVNFMAAVYATLL